MLPRTTFVLPMHVEPGRREITVDMPQAWGSMTQTWRNVIVPETGENTLYIRMMRWNTGPYEWVPEEAIEQETSIAAKE